MTRKVLPISAPAAPTAAPPAAQAESEDKMKRSFLSLREQVILIDWLRANADKPTTRVELAKRASKELGFSITESNVKNVAKEMGIKLNLRMAVNEHTQRGKYRSSLRVVAHSLAVLMLKVGEPVPKELAEIADGIEVDQE